MSDLRTDRASRPVPNAAAGPEAAAGGAKRLVTAGIALGAVAAFGIGIWFAYDQGVKRGASGAPPLVRAEQGPAKVAPENPGGLQVPNQDKQIYERLAGSGNSSQPQTERLLPPPERPLERPPVAAVAPAPAGSTAAGPTVTIPTRPAVNGVPGQAPAAEPAPAQRQATAPAATPPAANPVPTPPRPAQSQPQAAAPAARPTAPAAATAGSARVQLASLPEQAQAQATWAALQRKFAADLGGLSANYERVEIPGKGVFYRVQAGPLKDRAAAQALCEKLSAQKQGCIVVGR